MFKSLFRKGEREQPEVAPAIDLGALPFHRQEEVLETVTILAQSVGLDFGIKVEVPEGECWVVTLFGKAVYVLEPGFNFVLPPFISKIGARVPVRRFRINLPVEDLNARSSTEVTEPDVVIRIDTVGYARIIDPKVVAYDLQIPRDPDNPLFISIPNVVQFIGERIIAELRQFTAARTIDELIKMLAEEKRQLSKDIQRVLLGLGILLTDFSISQPIPNPELLKARQRAGVQRERMKALQIEAEGEKQAQITRAEGQRASAVALLDVMQEAAKRNLSAQQALAVLTVMAQLTMTAEERGEAGVKPLLIMGAGGGSAQDPIVYALYESIQELLEQSRKPRALQLDHEQIVAIVDEAMKRIEK